MKGKKLISLVMILSMILSFSIPAIGQGEDAKLWYCVQAAVTTNKDTAFNIALNLYKLGFEEAFIFDDPNSHNYYVMAGGFEYRDDAQRLVDEVKKHKGYESAWITEKNFTRWDIIMAKDLVEKTWFTIQTGVFSTKENALNQVQKMIDDGFANAFGLFLPDDTHNHYALAGKFETKEEAENYAEIVKQKGYDYFIKEFTFRNIDTFRPDDPVREYPPHEEFMNLVDQLPDPDSIIEIIVKDKVNSEKARKLYNEIANEEREKIEAGYLEKLVAVEEKIQSLKTPIKSETGAVVRQAQAWAVKRGAHKRYVDIAPMYWIYGEKTGMRPEILYTQAGKETNFGKYTGAVKPEMNNWAGIKIADPVGDRPEDHETFDTPEDGVRGHFNHLGIYCGVDPIGEPHPRWYKTKEAEWAGTIQYVEDLGGLWAPNPDYGISIIRDYMRDLYNTPVPSEEDMNTSLEFSNGVEQLPEVEELTIDDLELVQNIINEYDNVLTDSQKALIPYNIKDSIEELRNWLNRGFGDIQEVIDLIEKLPEAKDLKMEHKEEVERARSAFEKLSQEQKILVSNIDKLIEAEQRIAELEGSEDLDEPTDPEKPEKPKDPKEPKDPSDSNKSGNGKKPVSPKEESDKPEDNKGILPKTGYKNNIGFYSSGLLLLVYGMFLGRKKQPNLQRKKPY